MSVQARKRRNRISALRNDSDQWVQSPHALRSLILNFYSDVYQVCRATSSYLDVDWDDLQLPRLSQDQVQGLLCPFSEADIREAMFSIASDKSPRPDGFSAAFFKIHWDTVGAHVVLAVQYFFAHGFMLKNWNRTYLFLLPKVDHPEEISQYRPIGLCNVIYKCIAKCLTHRLQGVMSSLISDTQNAFVPGPLMSDDCLLAHELITFVNNCRNKRMCYVPIKLDINKAYDRVLWDFLFKVLAMFGFPPYWIHIIKQCVSTVSYQVLVNGGPTSSFQPHCGLRQGDPLSPYFLVVSGQLVNFQKSFVKFSSNTPKHYRDFVSAALRLGKRSHLGKYLGVQVDLGRSKCSAFYDMVDTIVRRISNFASLRLSAAAKLVLSNSVLVASISHVLSVFKIPQTICDRIDQLCLRWRTLASSSGMVLRPAALFYLPKGMGGLGIRRLSCFNQALLGRQAWRLLHQPQLLLSRLYQARYPRMLATGAAIPFRPSWGSRGIMAGAQVLFQGMIWKVGSGSRVRITLDSWVPDVQVSFKPSMLESDVPTLVSYLIDPRSYAWDVSVVQRLFDNFTSSAILALGRPPTPMDDFVCWKHFWGLRIHPKFKIFVWKLLHNALPVAALLFDRGLPVDPKCSFCYSSLESVAHLFRDCPCLSVWWATSSGARLK
ncbi:uncharacterized protein [Spinacia oleracea]|uniref:Reverse transcriptase domain-containing protein n=1 Tax=Spinacia oleracea TaxID=3562 RepID=A0ABM3RRG0_SPIOL|nr:uncharacterized protein LOC130471884 [Spinacia oleracea]